VIAARRSTLGALGAGVLMLHLLLVGAPRPLPLAVPAAPAVPAVLAVRQVAAAPPPLPEVVAEPVAVAPAPPPRPAAKQRSAAVARVPSEAPVPARPMSPPARAVDPPADAAPVYATRFAPPSRLRYRLRRGAADGEVDLHWQPDGDRYTVRFAARLEGAALIAQTSTGAFDAAGLAPQRFVDQRQRSAAAANFQRDRGIVSFSGPTVEHPLPAGAQDRLSWMFQLAAVVAAQPALAAPGGRILLPVFGARGDAGTWVFEAVEDGAAADAGLVHLQRRAGGPYDAAVEVWLDPRRHHLPARVVLHGAGEGRPALELALVVAAP
jgi:hypothetical protein